jgi:hypothetical protein
VPANTHQLVVEENARELKIEFGKFEKIEMQRRRTISAQRVVK